MNARLLMSCLLVVATACGGKAKSGSTTSTFSSRSETGVSVPMPFEASAKAELEASVMLPHALSSLEWPAPPVDRPVATQRRRFAAAGPDARQKEAAALATALWYSQASGSAAETTAREEARTMLRGVVAAGGASETVLAMLTVAERALGDAPASAKIYDELILRFPQSPRAWRYRAVRAWLELQAQDTQRAAEIVDGADLGSAETPSAVYYVAGWIALRQGEQTKAHALLITAIQRWDDLWSWDTVRHEAFQIAALAGVKPDYMRQIVAEVVNGPPKREAGTTNKRIRTVVRNGRTTRVTEESSIEYSKEWLTLELGQAYAKWGNATDATELLQHAVGGDPYTNAVVSYELMKLALAENHPAAVVAHARATQRAITKAIAESSASGVGELEAALEATSARLAAQFATFAQFSGIAEYRDASVALATIGKIQPPVPTQPSSAAYQRGVLDAQLAWTRSRLLACYAAPLQSQAAFDGSITFDLTPGEHGAAILANLTPAAGDAGLARVAGCVSRVIASWRLPPAPNASTTTAHIKLQLHVAP